MRFLTFNRYKQIISFIFILFAIFFLSLQLPDDADLGIHLTVGRYILATHQIPRTDLFSFSLPNHPYVYHSWLSGVLMAWVYGRFGLLGLTLGLSLVVTVGVLGVFKRMKRDLFSLLLLLVTTAIVFWSVGIRPQAATFALFSLVAIILFSFRDAAVKNQKRAVWQIFLLPLLFFCWVNLHGGFFAGLVLLGLFLLGEVTKQVIVTLGWQSHFKVRLKPVLTGKALVLLFSVTALSVLATLVNPYGLGVYDSVFRIGQNPFNVAYNAEWIPFIASSQAHVVVVGLVLASFLILLLGRVDIELTEIVLVMVFFFLALRSVRLSLYFFVVFLPFLSTTFFAPLDKLKLLQWRSPPIFLAIIACIFALLTRSIYNLETVERGTSDPKFLAAYRQHFPYAGVEYIKTHAVPTHLMNFYNWGGYMFWHMPERRVFQSGIMDIFVARSGKFFMEEYFELIDLGPNWQKLLDYYQIEGIFLPPQAPIVQMVKTLPDWQVVYEDEISVLAVRK